MKTENPAALRFIMPDELYLLNSDRALYANLAEPANSAIPIETPATLPPPVSFKYLGKNKKLLLIIVNYPNLEFIHEAHLTALQSILKRLDFELDDVAILNRAKHEKATFDELAGFFNPAKLLILGTDALPGGIASLQLNQPKKLQNCNMLFSYSFDEMMDSSDNKKAFWEQMKQL